MRLAGLRASTGALVALTEDFCVPTAGWAEALLGAHGRQLAPVLGGPIARLSGTVADWALTLIEYGRFFQRDPEGPVADLPSINVAYDRQRLLAVLPPDAAGFFEVEVHARLRQGGHTFYRLPAAVMFDYNTRRLRSGAVGQYHHGRLFGGGRAAEKGLVQRLKYAALSPAVPAVLLARIARQVGAVGQTAQLFRALPALSVLLAAWAVGEGMGSAFGPGDSAARWT
jgi:hypothetical protein